MSYSPSPNKYCREKRDFFSIF